VLETISLAILSVFCLSGALCVLAWVVYVPVCMRVFGEGPVLPAVTGQAADHGEQCELSTPDGVRLRGTYLTAASAPRQGVIAFCHELGGDRYSGMRYGQGLRERGFDVFLFDFRHHGDSQTDLGHRPLPWLTETELDDVRAVVDYLASREDADPSGIGIMGISKGGTAALCAAAVDPRVKAVITDGAFPTKAMQIHYIRRYMEIYTRLSGFFSRLPDPPLAALAGWTRIFIGIRHRCRFVDVEALCAKVQQPVLMIHGDRDRFVPHAVAMRLRGCLEGPSKMWIVSRAKHNGAILAAETDYHERAAKFFRRYLGQRPARRRPRRRIAPRLARRAG